MPNSSSLSAINISKKYGPRLILEECNIHVAKGEVIGMLGPNGAGKTTLFSIIAGLVNADTGHIMMDDHDISLVPAYRRARMGLGYLPQEPSIFRGLSVEDNILAVLEIFEPELDDRSHRLEELLAEFAISHLRHAPSIALSGGERRRVEIARAMAAHPHYILLDEPLAGIDPIAIHDIRALISHLKDRNIGVLITDHNVRETLSIVDRAYILSEGKVLMEGTPKEIVKNEKVRRVYLGESFSL